MNITIYNDAELEALPEPEWLIEGFLPEAALVVLFGAQGSGKSFVALDWACHIASGTPWQGQGVQQGPVVYIAAEGHYGYKKRVRAWKYRAGLDPSTVLGVHFVGLAVNFLDTAKTNNELQALADAIERALPEKPSLIVVDTLSRCVAAGAGDENSSQDMGRFVAACDALKGAFGCSVMVVHHSGWEGSHERGSTVLPGAADTRIFVERTGLKRGRFSCMKQKDHEEFGEVRFTLAKVDESCVVEVQDIVMPDDGGGESLDDNEHSVLAVVHKLGGEAKHGDIKREVVPDPIANGSFHRVLQRIVRKGLLEESKRGTYGLNERSRRLFPPILKLVKPQLTDSE